MNRRVWLNQAVSKNDVVFGFGSTKPIVRPGLP